MDGVTKPMHQVVQEFTVVLLRRNPMNLDPGNPLEYEAEALSILSRFVEAGLQLPDDEAMVAQVASGIVKQALEFWFENIGDVDPEPIARDLLKVYRTAFESEKEEQPKVTQVTVGE